MTKPDEKATCAAYGCSNPVDGRFEDNDLCQFHIEYCIDERAFEHSEDFDPRRIA